MYSETDIMKYIQNRFIGNVFRNRYNEVYSKQIVGNVF